MCSIVNRIDYSFARFLNHTTSVPQYKCYFRISSGWHISVLQWEMNAVDASIQNKLACSVLKLHTCCDVSLQVDVFLLCENVKEEKRGWWWKGVRPGLISCAARVPRLVHTQHVDVHIAEMLPASHSTHIHRLKFGGNSAYVLFVVNLWWYICMGVWMCERKNERVCVLPSYSLIWEGECLGLIVEHIAVHGNFDEKLESVIFNFLHLGFGTAMCVPWQADGQKCPLCSSWNHTLFPCGSDTKLVVMCLQVMHCKWQPVTVSQNVNHTMLKQSIQIPLGTLYISDLGLCLYVYVYVYVYMHIYIYTHTIFKAQSYYGFF